MPHYMDGMEAKIGDFAEVTGEDPYYNGFRGEITSVNESDSCNATIAKVEVMAPTKVVDGKRVVVIDAISGYPNMTVASRTVTLAKCKKIG